MSQKEAIVKQVEEIKGMVNEFSNFARMPASNPAPDRLNEIIQETLVLFKEGHRDVRFEFVPSELPLFKIDREQMKRVLLNLMDNALAAIPGSGKITISSKTDLDRDLVELTVADSGAGIPDRDKARIFETFYRGRDRPSVQGTGMGLAIAKAIVEAHGGLVSVCPLADGS